MQEMNILKARSFWMLAGAVVSAYTGLPAEVVATVGQGIADGAGKAPVETAVPVILAGAAYLERLFGKKKLVLGRERR
jgi:hypothetical protein